MSYSSDASYNSSTRNILMKADVYLQGADAAPLEVTRDNYLITIHILEEATSGDTPFESISSNEITVTLHNPDSIFSPHNSSGPYYSLIKRGVKIIPYIRTSVSDDWTKLGQFYVTDWRAPINSGIATITADDSMYDVFGAQPADLRVAFNQGVANFYRTFFDLYGLSPVIDDTLIQTLPIAYVDSDNKEFLSALTSSLLSICNCNHDGRVSVINLRKVAPLRITLTDMDQLQDVDAQLSINSDYDAAHLTYNIPHTSDDVDLLEVAATNVALGENHITYILDKAPLVRIKSISYINEEALCNITSFVGTSKTITVYTLNSSENIVTTKLTVRGNYVEKVPHEIGEEGSNTLDVKNLYIQSNDAAAQYLAIMTRFTGDAIPVVKIALRGNANLQIGDKVRITSERYNIDFTGVIMRQEFTYNGGLSSRITLLNSSLLEVTV